MAINFTFCLHGHDTSVTGFDSEGRCRVCGIERDRRYNQTNNRNLSRRRYEASERGKTIRQRYERSAPGILSRFRRRLNESLHNHSLRMEELE